MFVFQEMCEIFTFREELRENKAEFLEIVGNCIVSTHITQHYTIQELQCVLNYSVMYRLEKKQLLIICPLSHVSLILLNQFSSCFLQSLFMY